MIVHVVVVIKCAVKTTLTGPTRGINSSTNVGTCHNASASFSRASILWSFSSTQSDCVVSVLFLSGSMPVPTHYTAWWRWYIIKNFPGGIVTRCSELLFHNTRFRTISRHRCIARMFTACLAYLFAWSRFDELGGTYLNRGEFGISIFFSVSIVYSFHLPSAALPTFVSGL